jgi:hypothetical protein
VPAPLRARPVSAACLIAAALLTATSRPAHAQYSGTPEGVAQPPVHVLTPTLVNRLHEEAPPARHGAGWIAGAAALGAGAQARVGRAFAIEAAGGILGSAAGFGLAAAVVGMDDCDVEDLECLLRDLASALASATAGAGVGSNIAGRLAGTRPSGLGAALGAIAGVAAGLGVVHLLSEELNVVRSDVGLIASFAVTQGLVDGGRVQAGGGAPALSATTTVAEPPACRTVRARRARASRRLFPGSATRGRRTFPAFPGP